MKKYLTISILLLAFPSLNLAQKSSSEKADKVELITRVILWDFTSSQGNYMVNVVKIESVSMHSYIVDGIATVYEVNVATMSPVQARFYYIEPTSPNVPSAMGQHVINSAKSRLDQLQKRVDGADLAYMVQKKYPESTHAKTVEYRLKSRDELDRVYQSVSKAFKSQRSRSVTIEN